MDSIETLPIPVALIEEISNTFFESDFCLEYFLLCAVERERWLRHYIAAQVLRWKCECMVPICAKLTGPVLRCSEWCLAGPNLKTRP